MWNMFSKITYDLFSYLSYHHNKPPNSGKINTTRKIFACIVYVYHQLEACMIDAHV